MAAAPKLAAANAARAAAETPEDSALVVSRTMWGPGNVTPVDHSVGATAIVKLGMVPKSTLGFIGCSLGERLYRYAKDTDIWVDAFETDAVTVGPRIKHKSIKLNGWKTAPALFKANRYTTVIISQPSCVCPSLDTVFGQAAHGLKTGGVLYAVDLMRCAADTPAIAGPTRQSLRTQDEHKAALDAAGFAIENEFDLTPDLMATIRAGFIKALEMFSELQEAEEPEKTQRQHALVKQLEIWGPLYLMARKRMLCAMGFLVVKRNPA